MLIRRAAVVTACAVFLVACQGDDDATDVTVGSVGSPTSTEVETTTSTTSVAATTSASLVPTTELQPTTAITTTTHALTEPTSTSEPPNGVDDRIAVLDAVEASSQASLDVVRDPTSDQKIALLDEHFTGVLLEGWQRTAQSYQSDNQREIENPKEPDSFEAELASLAVNEENTFATVQGCSVTSGIIVEVGGNSDGIDRVIEDGVSRLVIEFEVRRVDGVWKVADALAPDEVDRIASCK